MAANRGEMLKVMRPMMMNKVFSTDTMQLIMKCAYDLLGGDGIFAPTEAEANCYVKTRCRESSRIYHWSQIQAVQPHRFGVD